MNRIVYVIIITVLLFGVVIFQQVFADSTIDELIARIDSLSLKISEQEQINSDQILEISQNLDEFWTEKEKILCLIISHNDLTKVGEQIKRVNSFIQNNDKENCVVELSTLKFYAESYRHVMEINFQNLF